MTGVPTACQALSTSHAVPDIRLTAPGGSRCRVLCVSQVKKLRLREVGCLPVRRAMGLGRWKRAGWTWAGLVSSPGL